MQRLRVGSVDLAYRDEGVGPETVVFSHSFLVDSRQYEHQIEALTNRYRVVAFDHRDHGSSSRATESYELADLVDDAVTLVRDLDLAPCHWVGHSTGGFVGMRIAYQHPELLSSVVLMSTDAGSERPVNRAKNEGLRVALRLVGLRPLMGTAMKTMFGSTFLEDPTRADEVALWRERIAANDPDALGRFGNAVFSRDDVLDRLRQLDLPTLVVVGDQDRALPRDASLDMAEAIPGARLEVIRQAGHLCTIDQAEAVTQVLVRFLEEQATH